MSEIKYLWPLYAFGWAKTINAPESLQMALRLREIGKNAVEDSFFIAVYVTGSSPDAYHAGDDKRTIVGVAEIANIDKDFDVYDYSLSGEEDGEYWGIGLPVSRWLRFNKTKHLYGIMKNIYPESFYALDKKMRSKFRNGVPIPIDKGEYEHLGDFLNKYLEKKHDKLLLVTPSH